MKNLSKFEITMISAFVVVLGLGIAGWWYTGTMQEEANQRMQSANSQLNMLQTGRFTPDARVVQQLDEKIKLVDETLTPIEQGVLQPEEDVLASVQSMNPTVWKDETLSTAVQRMAALARSKNIKLPTDQYYFGFDRYIRTTPQQKDIVNLTKQLIGIETAFGLLADAGGVREVLAIRRSNDEDGRIDHSAAGMAAPGFSSRSGSSSSGSDRLNLNIELPYNGLYEVLPLEFEFKSEPESVRGFLNRLAQSKLIYVVRSVSITTNTQQSPRLSEIMKKYESMEKKRNQIVFGAEQVVAKVRFDLVDWLGAENMKDPDAPENQPRQAQR